MKRIFGSKPSKIVVDILMLFIFVFTIAFADVKTIRFSGWNSLHCLFGLILLLLMALHIAQHWLLIKSLTKKRVLANNKIVAGVILFFCLTFLSICLFTINFNMPFLEYHNAVGHFFALGIVVHTVHKFKRFLGLFCC